MKQKEKIVVLNVENFCLKIKQEVTKFFLLTYQDSDEFLEKYDNSLLTLDIIEYEAQQYFFTENDRLLVYEEDRNSIIRAAYTELIELVLNRLVDEGVLELIWSTEDNNFAWRRKVRSKDDNRRTKNKG